MRRQDLLDSLHRLGPPTEPMRNAAGSWFKRYVRRLWASRGGGFYGFVATLMFLYLEVLDIAGDIVDLGGGRLELGWIISFVVSNLVELLINTIRAALWPITWLQHFGIGLVSAGLLGAVYIGYLGVRPRVMRWLEADGSLAAGTSAGAVPGVVPGAGSVSSAGPAVAREAAPVVERKPAL